MIQMTTWKQTPLLGLLLLSMAGMQARTLFRFRLPTQQLRTVWAQRP